MLLCAHTGLTLGAVKSLSLVRSLSRRKGVTTTSNVKKAATTLGHCSLRNFIDYRLVLVGSLLPDIIDKPLGIILLGNGRAFAHSLLFNFILISIGIWLYYKRRRSGFLIFSLCSAGHLILDEMWHNPVTLFWPLYGRFVTTEAHSFTGWLVKLMYQVPEMSLHTQVAEIIGAVALVCFLRELITKRGILAFVKTGEV